MLLLKEKLDWNHASYLRRNKGSTSKPNDPLSEETKELVREKNHLDVELYDFYRRRLMDKYNTTFEDGEAHLAAFQKRNRAFSNRWKGLYEIYDRTKALLSGYYNRPK